MRAGFETYRTFLQDKEDFRSRLAREGKLKMPLLALAGEASAFAPVRLLSTFSLPSSLPPPSTAHALFTTCADDGGAVPGFCRRRDLRNYRTLVALGAGGAAGGVHRNSDTLVWGAGVLELKRWNRM